MKKTTVLWLLVIASLAACKKIDAPTEKVSTSTVQKLKDWYQKQKPPKVHSQNLDGDDLPEVEPDWDEVQYYPTTFLYKIPLDFEIDNPRVAQYLLLHQDNAGNILSGEYAFILLKDIQNNITKEGLETLFPKLTTFDDMPAELAASMVKYNLNGEFIDSKKVENSIISITEEKLEFVEKNAPLPECQATLCTDWYWTTWLNGVVITESYLYTTCTCISYGGGGGTTGNGNNSPTSCQSQLTAFSNQGHSTFSPVAEQTLTETSSSIKKKYIWKAYTAGTWGLLSYEEGVIAKIPGPNNITVKQFESFTHTSMASVGFSIGGTRTFQDLGASINVTPFHVQEQLDFTVTHKVACIVTDITLPYTATAQFNITNNIGIE